jgi:hypothetical protein
MASANERRITRLEQGGHPLMNRADRLDEALARREADPQAFGAALARDIEAHGPPRLQRALERMRRAGPATTVGATI